MNIFKNLNPKKVIMFTLATAALTAGGLLYLGHLSSPLHLFATVAIAAAEVGLGYSLLKLGGNVAERARDNLDGNYHPEADHVLTSPEYYAEYGGPSRRKDKDLTRELADLLANQKQTVFNSLTQPSILRKLPFIGKYFRGEEEVQYTVPAHKEPLNSIVAGGHHLRKRP